MAVLEVDGSCLRAARLAVLDVDGSCLKAVRLAVLGAALKTSANRIFGGSNCEI